jgi:hypothetical protein
LICLLAEVQGTPVTHVARAGTVRETMLFLPRKPSEPAWQWDTQTPVVAMFCHDERLYGWPLQLEEVLPASYFLASLGEPALGGRRGFVRTEVPVAVRLTTLAGHHTWQGITVDLSSAGVRLPMAMDLAVDAEVELELQLEGVRHAVRTRARMVRQRANEVALEFVALASADEDAVERAVFLKCEQELATRLR